MLIYLYEKNVQKEREKCMCCVFSSMRYPGFTAIKKIRKKEQEEKEKQNFICWLQFPASSFFFISLDIVLLVLSLPNVRQQQKRNSEPKK